MRPGGGDGWLVLVVENRPRTDTGYADTHRARFDTATQSLALPQLLTGEEREAERERERDGELNC